MTAQLCGWSLETEDFGDILVVRLPGARELLNVSHLQHLSDELYRLFSYSGRKQLALDFALVDFFHSDALDQLVQLQKRLQQIEGSLCLWNVDRHLFSVLETTQLDRVLNARTDAPMATAM